jgi:hypothetical protein
VAGVPFALMRLILTPDTLRRVSTEPEADPRVVRSRVTAESPRPPDPERQRARPGFGDPLRVRDTLIEKIIADAQAAGAFENLPYVGEPLPEHDDAAAGDLASAFRLLRNAGAAPRWIETDKEIRRLLGERDVIFDRARRAGPLSRDRYRTQLRALVEDVNRLVLVLNHEAPSPRQHRRPLDVDREMGALERRWPK